MVGSDWVNPTHYMQPAVKVGGQRRRIARRPNMPRSNTTPAFGPESSTTASSAGAVNPELSPRPGTVKITASVASSSSMMNFYSPTDGLDGDLRPSPTSRPSDIFPKMSAAHSPTPTAASASSTTTEGKKKHGKFSFKSKDQARPTSSHGSPLPLLSSPLPPLTPVKAAQLLGVDTGTVSTHSGSIGRQIPHDSSHDDLPVRPLLTKQASMSMLTDYKDVTSRQTKFREEDVAPDLPKSKGFWGSSTKKAVRMLDLLPSVGSSSKRAADLERAAAESMARYAEQDTETSHSSEPNFHARPRLLPAAARPLPEAPKRRARKRGPKSLDKMAPITETSHDALHSSYRNSEYNTELDVISEYERNFPPHSAPLPRSHTESMLTTGFSYELEADDLSETDGTIAEEEEPQEEDFTAHPGKEVNLNKVKWQQPAVVHLRGPLQTVEDRLLDAAEHELVARKAKLNQNDATRLIVDTDAAAMKASHEKMKKDFEAAKQAIRSDEPVCAHGVDEEEEEAEEEEDDDLISISSSIDLDEESTVHVAKVMTFTLITPGMVKLVDIPTIRKKPDTPAAPAVPVAPVAPAAPASKIIALAGEVRQPFKLTYTFDHDEQISPFNERSENVVATVMPDLSLTYKGYNRATKDKKAKLPRDESQLLVQDWMRDYDHTKQRPVSERIDPDVLADQQIPPAPFPKEDHPTPPPPPRSSSRQHYCLNNGHIFHPIDLKTVPDNVAINSLEVRPYLHTPVGHKQHVRVPVFCDRCGEDVKEELWECEVPVCHMVVCRQCAEDMEQEWQARAVDAWAK